MVARRVVADGRLNGVVIVPSGEWGTRVAAAFAEELKSLGGTVLDSGRYDSAQVDFSDVIKTVMQLKARESRRARSPSRPRIAATPRSSSWPRAAPAPRA